METARSTPEMFPAPDWRRRWVRVTDPPAGTHLKVCTPRGRVVQGRLERYEKCRAGVLVAIDTGDRVEEFVLPELEVTIPLPLY